MVIILILNFILELWSDINFVNIRKFFLENLVLLLLNVMWIKEDVFRRIFCIMFGKICFVNNENFKFVKVFVRIIIIKKLFKYVFNEM